MPIKFASLVFSFIFCLLGITQSFSQTNCTGANIFTEKLCSGDEISERESELYRLVNEYRAQNNLPQVPISKSLSVVANRHLLDLIFNLKSLTHSWSNCVYEINNQKTWSCVFDSPKRLNSGYSGKGYENLYRNKNGNATAVLALEAWKKSDLHNSLLINLNSFKDVRYDALGVAVNGQYAAIWFGSTVSDAEVNSSTASLGLNFEKTILGLTKIITVENAPSFTNGKWLGISSDKSVRLRLTGSKEDLTEAEISVKADKNNLLSEKQKDIFKIFLNNTTPEWAGRENWLNEALMKIAQNPKASQTISLGTKIITLTLDAENNFSLNVKFYKNPKTKML